MMLKPKLYGVTNVNYYEDERGKDQAVFRQGVVEFEQISVLGG